MTWSSLETILVTGLVALCTALVSAWFTHSLGRKKTGEHIQGMQEENEVNVMSPKRLIEVD